MTHDLHPVAIEIEVQVGNELHPSLKNCRDCCDGSEIIRETIQDQTRGREKDVEDARGGSMERLVEKSLKNGRNDEDDRPVHGSF
jgi:hypothetical protein